ncbi:uncharacterized protein LOC111102452 [Crassostrea virginica]
MFSKKQRKSNFSDTEVEMLVEAVCYNYHILYGKFSPNLTNSMKMSAWADVTEKVNAVSLQCRRDMSEVQKKWQDVQSAAKKKECERRKYLGQTGGGPAHSGSMKSWEEKVCLCHVKEKKHDKLSINFEAIVLVPAEELNMGNTTAAPFEGKRRAQPMCDGTVHSETQRLIEIEEENLTIKRKRLAIEQEKLEIMKNFIDLLQTYCLSSQSAQNLLSSM